MQTIKSGWCILHNINVSSMWRTTCSPLAWTARVASWEPSARCTNLLSLAMASLENSSKSSSRKSQGEAKVFAMILFQHTYCSILKIYWNVSPRPSRSSYQKKMSEYIGAELAGRKEGDCFKFERDCSRFDSKQFCKVPPTTICLSSDRSSSWTSIQGRRRW